MGSVEVSFDESQPRVPSAQPARSEPPSEVMTSAKPVARSRPEASAAMPLRRPSRSTVGARSRSSAVRPVQGPEQRAAIAAAYAPRRGRGGGPPGTVVAASAVVVAASAVAEDGRAIYPAAQAHVPAACSGQGLLPTARSRQDRLAAAGKRSRAPRALRAHVRPERGYDDRAGVRQGSGSRDDRREARLVVAPRRRRRAAGLESRRLAALAVTARSWPNEKPASAWLSDGAREAFVSRAEWLEKEARSLADKVSRARALLSCSEILATAGEGERAQALAAEARDLAPSVALAHRQARALMPSPPDSERLCSRRSTRR